MAVLSFAGARKHAISAHSAAPAGSLERFPAGVCRAPQAGPVEEESQGGEALPGGAAAGNLSGQRPPPLSQRRHDLFSRKRESNFAGRLRRAGLLQLGPAGARGSPAQLELGGGAAGGGAGGGGSRLCRAQTEVHQTGPGARADSGASAPQRLGQSGAGVAAAARGFKEDRNSQGVQRLPERSGAESVVQGDSPGAGVFSADLGRTEQVEGGAGHPARRGSGDQRRLQGSLHPAAPRPAVFQRRLCDAGHGIRLGGPALEDRPLRHTGFGRQTESAQDLLLEQQFRQGQDLRERQGRAQLAHLQAEGRGQNGEKQIAVDRVGHHARH